MILTTLFSAFALQSPEAADIVLRLSGSGQWAVECRVQTENGERTETANGRGLSDFETLRVNDARSAACAYTVEDRAQMRVRVIEADGFSCPFGADMSIDACQTTFIGPAEGEFSLDRG